MGVMTVTGAEVRDALVLREGPFTIADRDALPEDGRRHELLDGMLVMSASPRLPHQLVAARLLVLLDKAVDRTDLVVVSAPVDVRRPTGSSTALQPDLLVARAADLDRSGFTTRPVLCVEIASPSTRLLDLGRKSEVYAELGCPSYWTIEPEPEPDPGPGRGPELTVWTLDSDHYRREAVVTGTDSYSTTTPFAVTVVPEDLLDPRFR